MLFDKAIKYAEMVLEKNRHQIDIVLIANVLPPRGYDNQDQINCSETEHFTLSEFDEIYQGVVAAGFFIRKVFFSEVDFIRDIIVSQKEYSSSLVFNLCRNGEGMNRKTVVPAICDLLQIRYTSSGPSQCALARNKYLFTTILLANGVICPVSAVEAETVAEKLQGEALVICKPNNESASQGLNEKSIIKLENIKSYKNKNVLFQEYIDGIECEVPVYEIAGEVIAASPVGISFVDSATIITEQSSAENNYGFFALSDVIDKHICDDIRQTAQKAFKLLGLRKYGRIDFRIDKKTHAHYVIDISTTPYVTQHSSFTFAMSKNCCDYSDIFRLIVAASLS